MLWSSLVEMCTYFFQCFTISCILGFLVLVYSIITAPIEDDKYDDF